MTEPWITTKELCRYYQRGPQEIRAIDSVNLNIARGEFVGIVGSSGSGKSTLLNLLAGLDTPTAGSIAVGATVLSALSRKDLAAYRARQVGMIFQTFNLLPHHTALRNVEVALYFNDTPRNERHKRASEILTSLGMGDRLEHRPSALSGGEQQRVAIARALVKRPEVIFADEPTGNLDYENARQIAALLTDLNKEGLTVVMVSHDLELARSICNRIIKMHYGRIVEDSGAQQ
ncbi:MAG: ABC transporter ATP-binding protein [bacterium]|nr:ABC transporter ATP-binding protein [bacterium]